MLVLVFHSVENLKEKKNSSDQVQPPAFTTPPLIYLILFKLNVSFAFSFRLVDCGEQRGTYLLIQAFTLKYFQFKKFEVRTLRDFLAFIAKIEFFMEIFQSESQYK